MTDYPHIAIGRRLFELRKAQGLTQEEMAGRLELSLRHWSDLERGKIGLSRENLLKLNALFGVSIDYLLTGSLSSYCANCVKPAADGTACPLARLYDRCPASKRMILIDIIGRVVEAMR